MVKPILKINLNKVLPKKSVTLEIVNYDGCQKTLPENISLYRIGRGRLIGVSGRLR